MARRTSRFRRNSVVKSPNMEPKHVAFLRYLKSLGYEDSEIVYKPTSLGKNIATNKLAVFKKYTPTFYVEPELTLYDVDNNLTDEVRLKLLSMYYNDGYEFQAVTEEDFPFDEYVDVEEASSNEP